MKNQPNHFVSIGMIAILGLMLSACAGGPGGPGGPGGARGGYGGPPMQNDGGQRGQPPGQPDISEQITQLVSQWDHNSDGSATCDDLNTLRSRIFRTIDLDSNGTLQTGEFRHAKFEDKSFLFFDLATLDTNGSGAVDLEEFIATPHSMFQNIDQNQDCSLSANELLSAYRSQMMAIDIQGLEGESRGGRGGRGGGQGGPGGRGGGQGGGPGGGQGGPPGMTY